MACEDVETRPGSVITKIEPPAIPTAKEIETVNDKEQFNNILRVFFNRLVNAVNNLSNNGDSVNDAIEQIIGGDGTNGVDGGPASGLGDDNSLTTNLGDNTIGGNSDDLTNLVGGDTNLTTTQNIENLTYDVTELNNLASNNVRKYRYWRLVNATILTSYVTLSEIELMAYDPESGVDINVAPLATCTSSPQTSGNQADILNDGLTTPLLAPISWDSDALSSSFPTFFIMWDFGDNPQGVVSLRQFSPSVTTGDTFQGNLSTFEIEVSDNGIDWVRTFYVSWQYEAATSGLPDVLPDAWSEYYWLQTVDKPASGGGGGEWNHVFPPKTASFSAVAGDFYYCDCAGASANITITLPASPSDKDRVGYVKTSYSFNYEVIIDGGTIVVADIGTGGSTSTTPVYLASYAQGYSMIYSSDINEWIFYNSTIIAIAG